MGQRSGFKSKGGFLPQLLSDDGVSQSTQSKSPCGTIWPNGEFGLGYSPEREEVDTPCYELAGGVSVGFQRELCRDIREGLQPLDLTGLSNPHKPTNRPETYGRRGITNRGAKMVRNACHLLQEEVGADRLTFLTLTLPDMTATAAVALAESWAEAMRQLLQWLSRRLVRGGLASKVVSVTEVQPRRFEAGSLTCLHVHVVFVGRKAGKTWVIKPEEVRKFWLSLISRLSGEELDSGSCVDMKAVKKNAGNYLSKYMSKGAECISEYAERLGWDAVPRQWWNMTSEMRSQVISSCIRSRPAMLVLEGLVRLYYEGVDEESFRFVRAIEVEATEYQSFVVGFWGRLTDSGYEDVASLVKGAKLSLS